MSNRLILFIAALLMVNICRAQLAIPEDIPTPNASSLGRYGDIPVSFYTGNACISIPLFSTSCKGVDLNMSLDYDGSGVQMNALPGWTGHNWTLNVGGVITRAVGGYEDEFIYPKANVPELNGHITRYFNCYNALPDLINSSLNDYQQLKDSVSARAEMRPDIFTFNFMGYTGKFFLGNDGQWKVLSDFNIDVIFNIDDDNNYLYPFIQDYPYTMAVVRKQPKTIKGFTLRTEDGMTYEFGGTTDAIEYSVNLFRTGQTEKEHSWTANAWYLSKVMDKYGNSLYEFTYERGKYIAQFFYAGYRIKSVEDSYMYILFFKGHFGSSHTYGDYYNSYSAILNAPIYLKKIETHNGCTVTFYRKFSPQSYRDIYPRFKGVTGQNNLYDLSSYPGSASNYTHFYYLQSSDTCVAKYQYNDSTENKVVYPLSSTRQEILYRIIISGGLNSRIGQVNNVFDLEYNYDSRMHLERLDQYSDSIFFSQPRSIRSYHFRYAHYDELPSDYLTQKVDHWGYYNGRSFSYPHDAQGCENFYDQRNPKSGFMRLGALTKIIYPTGGVSVLQYEPHTFSKCTTDDRLNMQDTTGIAGGLRIRSITEYEDSTCKKVLHKRTFNYHLPGTSISSGELFAKPRYYWPNWSVYYDSNRPCKQVSQFCTTSIIPLSNSFGPHIGYSYVEEVLDDGSRTRYHFSNISAASDGRFVFDFGSADHHSATPSPYDMFSERGYKRGRLLSTTLYDKYGNKKKSTGYEYRYDNVENNYVLSSNINMVYSTNSGVFAHYTGGVYKLFFPKYDVIGIRDTMFTDNGNQITTRKELNKTDVTLNIISPYLHQTVTRIISSETAYRGNDWQTTSFMYPFQAAETLVQQLTTEMFCLEPFCWSISNNNQLNKSCKTTFSSVSVNGNNLPLPQYYIEQKGSVSDTITTYYNYDETGNLRIYKRMGEPRTTLLWGYKGYWLLGKAVGDYQFTTSELNQIYHFDRYSDIVQKMNTLRSMNVVSLTSYTYHPLFGVDSVTQPDGVATYYDYGRFSLRLDNILDHYSNKVTHFYYYNRR